MVGDVFEDRITSTSPALAIYSRPRYLSKRRDQASLGVSSAGSARKTARAGIGSLGALDVELRGKSFVPRCLADAGRPPAREQELQARLHAFNDGRNFLDRRQHSALHGVRGSFNLLNEIGNHPVRANDLRA